MSSRQRSTAGARAAVWPPLLLLFATVFLVGCHISSDRLTAWPRPFVFGQDTLAYPNELVWEYHFDPATGKTTHHRREPAATYAHRCFVVARTVRQFFQFAEFDPALPRADAAAYRGQIRRVISQNPRHSPPEWRILFPGYTNLNQFSHDHEAVLKEECGSMWQSYFQRGHWRMLFPFSDSHQEQTAQQLLDSVRRNRPAVVHVACVPSLRINHALLIYGANEKSDAIDFDTYDPNTPANPTTLTFDRKTRRFCLPRNLYFSGGRVDVYEVFHKMCY